MSSALRLAGEPIPPPPGPAVLAMGFRPFFLLAAAFGAVVVPLWLVLLAGRVPPGGGLPATWWHAHEMFFGYTAAVLAGFLLTAARSWSGGRPTAANGALAALVALWLGGRIAHAPGMPGGWWSALPDLAFLVGTAVAIGRPLVQAGSRRNYGFLVALPALGLASLGLHLAARGGVGWVRPSLDLPVAVLLSVMVVVAGRIVPMFTRNALAVEPVRVLWAEKALLPALAGVVAAALLTLPGPVEAGIHAVAGGLVWVRMAGWRSRSTLRAPLLWILHAGHAFVGLGLLLLAGAALWGPSLRSAGMHAITAGAIGSLTLGMMARVSLGHTGRPLRVGAPMHAAFVLMVLAAGLRIGAALVPGATWLLHGAGTAWSLALLLYLVLYLPILLKPRADGKPG